ncbi:MAG: hypothetical protein PHR65_00600 [Syntrophomonadaceae bacterium]|nr:hypothetical protein [Syntrophomonadaceae bacterium]
MKETLSLNQREDNPRARASLVTVGHGQPQVGGDEPVGFYACPEWSNE